ncbi:hypothetical protein DFJ74DRAFT_657116 [Hyaloraphidium curvatum]|nr:hypothetical protein DFJ74DRAFT_657116 [Hyaloraphidium curvatum]
MARLLLLLLVVLALLAGPALGLPAPNVPAEDRAAPGARAVFRRSCGECASSEFCEFGYPGAPESTVACIEYGTELGELYRRYGGDV